MKFKLLFLLLVLVPVCFALDCEYTTIEEYEMNTYWLYHVNSGVPYSNMSLEFIDFTTGSFSFFGLSKAGFRVYNPFNFDVNVSMSFNVSSDCGYSCHREMIFLIDAVDVYSFDKVDCPGYPLNFCTFYINESSLNYKILNPYYLEPKPIRVNTTRTVCSICPSGEECLNDGENCINSSECGGGYCTPGGCSNSTVCPNNDCDCPINQIQSVDNTKCVLKNYISVGYAPNGGRVEECITNYVNPDTGLCAVPPQQTVNEFFNIIFAGASIVLVVIIMLLNIQRKKNKEKSENLEKIFTLQKKIEKIDKRMKRVKKESSRAKLVEEKEKLENEKKELESGLKPKKRKRKKKKKYKKSKKESEELKALKFAKKKVEKEFAKKSKKKKKKSSKEEKVEDNKKENK